MECAGWSNEVFDKYVKHRHTLELNKLRKAKQRSKSKLVTSVIDQQVAGTAHSVSPSPLVRLLTFRLLLLFPLILLLLPLNLFNYLPLLLFQPQVIRWLLERNSILLKRS